MVAVITSPSFIRRSFFGLVFSVRAASRISIAIAIADVVDTLVGRGEAEDGVAALEWVMGSLWTGVDALERFAEARVGRWRG